MLCNSNKCALFLYCRHKNINVRLKGLRLYLCEVVAFTSIGHGTLPGKSKADKYALYFVLLKCCCPYGMLYEASSHRRHPLNDTESTEYGTYTGLNHTGLLQWALLLIRTAIAVCVFNPNVQFSSYVFALLAQSFHH